jgi:hypothetical protein
VMRIAFSPPVGLGGGPFSLTCAVRETNLPTPVAGQ